MTSRSVMCRALVLAAVVVFAAASAGAQDDPPPPLEFYGFAQADAIADFNRNDPAWYDASRPSRLPRTPDEFGRDGHFSMSVRQTRVGARAALPTAAGDVSATIEFDLFAVNPDAGKTMLHLRYAYGQWKQLGAGQADSQFMDIDVLPNSLEYWGPNGMLFFRNVQVFWEPYRTGGSNVRIAIENPGATGDSGSFADRVELQNVKGRFPAPDVTGHYRAATSWGYVQVGGAMRYLAYDDLIPDDAFELSGHAWGWGVSVSSNVRTGADVVRLQAVYGRGIENYLNDAPIDLGVQNNPGNPVTPILGQALPVTSLAAFVDHAWSRRWSTSAGYSRVDVRNSDGQLPSDFRIGQYALANLLCTPADNVTVGGELLWAQRRNHSDGWSYDDYRVQFSFRYSFSREVR